MSSLELVDTMARSYNYTHDQVTNLELEFVYSLIWMKTEQDAEANSYKSTLNLLQK